MDAGRMVDYVDPIREPPFRDSVNLTSPSDYTMAIIHK